MTDSQEINGFNTLHQLISGYRFTQLIYVAAELRIAELLEKGSSSVQTLAQQTGSDPESLYRVLRALTTVGIFRESSEGFQQTELSRLLLPDIDGSLRALAIMRGEEVNWKPWGELLYAVKTGKSPFEKVFSMNLFEYYETYPQSGETFNEGMNITTKPDIGAILDKIDFSPYQCIVDVGGGLGQLLFPIIAKYPHLEGILYDLPHVIRDASEASHPFNPGERCQLQAGQFFDNAPKGGDLYLLKRILHDWSDELCIKILKNCCDAMSPGGKIMIFDAVVQEENDNPEGKVVDVHMMVVCPGGKERTREQFEQLFRSAGLIPAGITPIRQGLYALEAKKA